MNYEQLKTQKLKRMNIKIRYMLLVVMLIFSVMTKGQEFNPADPAEPASPPVSLILKVVPNGAGSVSGGGKYTVGTNVTLKASSNTGFVFVNWTDANGNVLSTASQYTHKKTEKEEVITANYIFNPGSPSEPSEPTIKPKHYLTLKATEGGSVSGGGRYEEGTSINVSASVNTGFYFVAWLNEQGDTVSVSRNFSYTMGKTDATLTAHFNFNPGSPSEPSEPTIRPKHYVHLSAGDGGTVSASNGRPMEGDNVTVTASPNTGYYFVGWYTDGVIVSSQAKYTFTMGEADVYLTALFQYNPSSPGEPSRPVVSKNSLYLMTVSAKPGDDAECALYFDAVSEVTDMSFQLGFPKGTFPLPDSLVVSERAVGYSAEHTLVNDSTIAISLKGGTLGVGTIKLLTLDLRVPEEFPVGLGNTITVSQVSVTNTDGTTQTASTRNSCLDVYKFGDADNSGVIDLVDLVMARDYLYGVHIDGFEPVAVDLNRNGIVDRDDIKLLTKLILDR